MTEAIKIGLVIYNRLVNDETISAAVGAKVFPIVAENETTFPFITYTRTGVNSATISKDGYVSDTVQFQIVVASNSYNESVSIAQSVRALFEFQKLVTTTMTIYQAHLVNISETYSENTFVQTMQFSCKIE